MNDYPDVAILIVTYQRPQEIRATIQAFAEHACYAGQLRWHIADDGSDGKYVDEVMYDFPHLHMTATITNRKGWGANVNKAINFLYEKANYVFLCEDDYVALRDLDVTAGVELMETNKAVGLLRYDGLSGHDLTLYLREIKRFNGDQMDYLLIDRQSVHLNVYSNRPHLRHRRFTDFYGPYPENASLGMTETIMAHRIKDGTPDAPLVCALHTGIPRAFDHIGHSRQGTEQDPLRDA